MARIRVWYNPRRTDFYMEIWVPPDVDAKEYIDDFLDEIFVSTMRHIEWDFV